MTRDAWESESFAADWDETNNLTTNPDRLQQLRLLSRLIVGVCRSPSHILDLGIGSALLETFIARENPEFFNEQHVLGLDSSEAMLTLARSRLEAAKLDSAVQLRQIDFANLHTSDVSKQFDCIICVQALHEVSHETKQSLFQWCAKHLAADGVFYIADRFIYDQVRFEREHETLWEMMGAELPVSQPYLSFATYEQKYNAKQDHIANTSDYRRWLLAANFASTVLYQKFNRCIIAARLNTS